MASLYHGSRNGHEKRGEPKDPKIKANKQAHTGNRYFASDKKPIRRASEQTSPQVARAVGKGPATGQGGGSSSGSSSVRRCPF
jgi:hypothetical protein